jgi:hypothetical protein
MMMSTTEPQSIIHHALRFERRIVRAVTNMNRQRRLQKTAAALALPRSILLKNTPSTDDDLSVYTTPGSIMSTLAHSAQPDDEEYYETINKNAFMSDCMMNSTCECTFVHFFIRKPSICICKVSQRCTATAHMFESMQNLHPLLSQQSFVSASSSGLFLPRRIDWW